MNCPVCGYPLPEPTGKRGRPFEYHKECRRVEYLFSWLENVLSVIKVTKEKKKELRGRLWYLANLMNIG